MKGISVALCTCNGAAFIREQLDSILSQTIPVDEIVICDDCSTDETPGILKEYSAKYPCIQIHNNEKRLGVCANFDKALHLCSGDLIFLSDQDDFWVKDKVEAIRDYFIKHPRKSVVFTDALLVDDKTQPLQREDNSLFKLLHFNRSAQLLFDCGFSLELLMLHYRVTGATVALKRDYLERIKIDPEATPQNYKPLHDARISIYAASDNVLGYITSPLTLYRIHEGQQVGLGNGSPFRISNNFLSSANYAPFKVITDASILPFKKNESFKFIEKRYEYINSFLGPASHLKTYFSVLGIQSFILWPYDLLHSCYRAIKY